MVSQRSGMMRDQDESDSSVFYGIVEVLAREAPLSTDNIEGELQYTVKGEL